MLRTLNNAVSSPRTTLAGMGAALGIVLAFVLPLVGLEIGEGKAQELAGALVLIASVVWGAIETRDNSTSSEQAGARR